MPRWLFWMLLTLLSWGIWAVLSKQIAAYNVAAYHSQAMSTFGLAPIMLALWAMKEPPAAGNRRRGIWLALVAGVVTSLGNVAYFAAMADAKASTILSITSLYPAVTILLAVPFLKERITLLQWCGMALSLAAIYLFDPPGAQRGFSAGTMYAIVALTMWGVTLLLQKMSTDDISGRDSALWLFAGFIPVAIVILLVKPLPTDLAPSGGMSRTALEAWRLASAIGFALAFGNWTILMAFAAGGKAAVIAPLSGLYPLVGIPLAVVWLKEPLSLRECAGILLALTAVVLLSYTPTATVAPASVEQE
jgi:drug/metabolite transporter (DMT)-like permease